MDIRRTAEIAAGLVIASTWIALPGAASAGPPPERVPPPECHRMLAEAKARFLRGLGPLTEPIPGQDLFDVVHYSLDLQIDPAAETLEGAVEARVRSVDASLDSLVLDFTSRAEMRVDSVWVDGVPARFTWSQDALGIALDRVLGVDEQTIVRIRYGGSPETGREGFRFRETPRSEPIIWTLSEPQMARSWWPCKDLPSDKATLDLRVTVPGALTAISNGILDDVISDPGGTRTWVWRETYPIATYLVSLAVCGYASFEEPYVTVSGDTLPVRFYVFPEHQTRAEEDFRFTVEMIEFYASVFGEYPFMGEKYGMAEVPWGGAMEHQTITSYGDMLITGTHVYDSVIAHELSHQWWGDCVTLETWDDIWLNEGFAVYSEALWEDHRAGRTAYLEYMRSIDRPSGFVGTVYAPSADPDSAFDLPYVYTVYDKGAWVLHMLRHVVGEAAFFEILRDYGADPQHAYRTANTAEFQTLAEDRSGRDLSWFFDEWVYGSGRPHYEWEWRSTPAGDGQTVALEIDQIQASAAVFRMPIDIAVRTLSAETTFTIVDSLRSQEFVFELGDYPISLALDPEGWVLKRVDERPLSLTLHSGFPNPFRAGTNIVFDLSREEQVDLAVYDVTGRLVKRLIRSRMPAARHTVLWVGEDENGTRVAPGVYFCRLVVGGRSEVVRLVALR